MKKAPLIFALIISLNLFAQTSSGEGKGMGAGNDSSSRKGFKFEITEVAKNYTFDIGKIGGYGRVETPEKFARIWELFRRNYALNSEGLFAETAGANTPNTAVTQNEFLYFVTENTPTVILTSTDKCARCSGKGRRTALFNGNGQGTESRISTVACEDCQGFGKISVVETIKLSFSGKLPVRPSKEDRQALAAKPIPVTAITISDKNGKKPEIKMDLSDERVIIFNEIKAKAASGDLDAEFKYAKYFEEGKYPVTRDTKAHESMMLTLAEKGYNQAFGVLARIHLDRSVTIVGRSRKIDPNEVAECIKWKLLFDGHFTVGFEVSEATQAEGKRRADSFLSSHTKPTDVRSIDAK